MLAVLACSLALVTSGHARPLSDTLTLEINARPLHEALEEIQGQTGMRLRAEAKLRDATMLLHVRDVPRQVLLERLAEAVHGAWHQQGEEMVLLRSDKTEQQLRDEHNRQMLARIQRRLSLDLENAEQEFTAADAEALARRLIALKRTKDQDPSQVEAWTQYERLKWQTPINRGFVRLVATLPLERIARMAPGERLLFTANPTQRQLPMPPQTQEIIRRLSEDQERWRSSLVKVEDGNPVRGDTVGDPFIQRRSFKYDADSLQIVVVRHEEMILCNLVFAHEVSNETLAQYYVAQGDWDQELRDLYEGAGPKDDQPLPLPPLAAEMQEAMRNRRGDPNPPYVSAELLERLLDPVRHDPLSLLVGEALRAYAVEEKLNLVAWLPDTVFYAPIPAGPVTVSRMRALLAKAGSFEWEAKVEDSWLIFNSRHPRDLGTPLPRANLADFIGKVYRAGRVKLDDYADLLASHETHSYSTDALANDYSLFVGAVGMGDHFGGGRDVIRLYGSLTPVQRRTLREGGSIPFRFLNDRQRQLVETLTYRSEINRYVIENEGMARVVGKQVEPTEAYARGLPNGGYLSMRLQEFDTIFAMRPGKSGKMRPWRAVDAYNLAWALHQQRPEFAADQTKFVVGLNRGYYLRLNYEEGVWNEYAMTEKIFDPDQTPARWTDLPEKIVTAIKNSMQGIAQEDAQQKKQTIPPGP
jgi:hypothetical protein